MVRAHLLLADGHVQVDEGVTLAKNPAKGATVWVDVIASSELGLAALPPDWGFHPLALEDCVNRQRRAKFERYPNHGFAVFQALDTGTDDLLDTSAICVFIQPGLVVSVHDRPLSAIDRVDRLVLQDTARLGIGSDRVIHAILDAVVDEFLPLIRSWEDRLDVLAELASSTGDDYDRAVVEELVCIRRNLVNTRRIMLPQLEVVKRMRDSVPEAHPARHYYQDVVDHVEAIIETCQLCNEVCNGALQVHADRSNERLNRVMKYLGIVSTMLLPMTVISGVFGMNFDLIPTAHEPTGFWVAVGMMLVSATALVGWFRYKHWL